MQVQTLLWRTTFSVGICALTEVESTLRLVGQILSMHDPSLSLQELIVATPNRLLADKLESRDGRLFVILEPKREGKIAALRRILQRATGDILILASADILLEKNSVSRLVHALSTNRTLGAADSKVELVNGEARLSDRVSTLLWELHNEMLEQLETEGELGHVAGDLMALRRDLIGELPDAINDDAYIGLHVRQKGYAVKRVQNALAWIAGPRNPADYVLQRSRILRGHIQLIGLFRTVPTTFEFTMLSRPMRNMQVLTRVMRKLGPSYVLTLFTAFFLELLSFDTAVLQYITRRKNGPWRVIQSTKKV